MVKSKKDETKVTIKVKGHKPIETTTDGIRRATTALATMGHNNPPDNQKIKVFVNKIENLTKDRDAINEDLREVYGDAKSLGYSTKTIRQVVRERAMDSEKRREQNELLDLYRHAVGLLDD